MRAVGGRGIARTPKEEGEGGGEGGGARWGKQRERRARGGEWRRNA